MVGIKLRLNELMFESNGVSQLTIGLVAEELLRDVIWILIYWFGFFH